MNTDARAGARTAAGWAWVTLAAVWLPLFWKLAPAWSASVEQAHGWAVPVLAAYFWAERARAARGTNLWIAHRREGGGWRVVGLGAAAGLALALTVLEANPLWPAAQWAGYGAAVVLTVTVVASDEGWRGARRFWFPVFFVSTALAWPTGVTLRLQSALAGLNTQIAATVVSAAGFPAVVSGNVIEVAGGFVGIDEACSGVRSLQAAWMAGWFFGELLRGGARRRLGMVVGALGAAVSGNLIRTTALTWIAAARGPATAARWHDAAGAAEMIGVLTSIAALAWWLGRGGRGAGGGGVPLLSQRATGAEVEFGGGRRRVVFGAIGAGLVAAVTPTIWYRWHEARGGGERVQWELRVPEQSWRAVKLPEATSALLRASAEQVFERDEAGGQAMAVLVRWEGDVANAVFAELHGPTVCLPAAGMGVEVSARPERVKVEGVAIDFSVGRFEAEGRVRQVMFCQWDAWLGRTREPSHATIADVTGWRLARVREGRRRGDAAYIIFVVPKASEAEARAWLGEWAPQWLRRR